MAEPLVVAVVGPTAAGKSDLSVALCKRLGGEVVNADAMQVYRGMDIGTAKISTAERDGVPHHLLDILDVTETATVAEFQQLARAAIDDCIDRGKVPVLAGGSALYVRAILDDFVFPGTDADSPGAAGSRAGGAEAPARCTRGSPRSTRRRPSRSCRATAGGSSARSRSSRSPAVRTSRPCPSTATSTRARCSSVSTYRGRSWTSGSAGGWTGCSTQGFVAEVRGLLNKGLIEGKTANRALGYSQVIALLDGEIGEAEARERTAQATRRFARRQDSWFRKDQRITWLPYDDPDLVEKALVVIAEGNRKATAA